MDSDFPAEIQAAIGPVSVSVPLHHGGRRVKAVLRHQLATAGGAEGAPDPVPDFVVEKRLRVGICGSPAREVTFYNRVAPYIDLAPLDMPRLLYSGRFGREDRLIMEGVAGEVPGLGRVLGPLSKGIVALEASSSRWLGGLSSGEREVLGPMEYFAAPGRRGGFRQGFRLNALHLGTLRGVGWIEMKRLFAIRRTLSALERQVQADAPCICHLDLSGKNLIQSGKRLTLIDWGEASIGRAGFDVGCILAQFARRHDASAYQKRRSKLLTAYSKRMTAIAPELQDAAARGRVYYLGCTLLFHLRHNPQESSRDELLRCIEEELAQLPT